MTSRTTPIRSVRICSFCASERVSQNRRGSMDMLRIHGPWRSGPRRIAHVVSCVGYVHPLSAKGPREGAEAECHPDRTPRHTNLEPPAEKNGRPRGTGDHRAGGRAPRRSPPPRPPVGCGEGHPGVRSFVSGSSMSLPRRFPIRIWFFSEPFSFSDSSPHSMDSATMCVW